jgi:diketogulonate reductase-like aldo/keto reductase
LHWPNGITDFSAVVTPFEKLVTAGKIRAWGVSNFKISQLEALFHVPHGDRCATNQVLYNLADRGIERDLLPWCEQHKMPVMAYSPLGGSDANLLSDSHSRTYWRSTRLLGGRHCVGVGHPERQRDRNS